MNKMLGFLILALFIRNVVAADDVNIGVYYFPGWKNGERGLAYSKPWDKISPYPEREPLLGWYQEGAPGVLETQLKWMSDYGIRFVVFDVYWGEDNKPFLEHILQEYMALPDKHGVKFAILWSNHTKYLYSKANFQSMFSYWSEKYFSSPDYWLLDGRPVFIALNAPTLNDNIKAIGMKQREFFPWVNSVSAKNSPRGLAFVGGVSGNRNDFDYSEAGGYDGFTAYNLHEPATFSFGRQSKVSHSFAELDASYRDQWQWMIRNSYGNYFVPIISGWDRRPWGGSGDPLHDSSVSSPQDFEVHIRAAKSVMIAQSKKTASTAIICCWNEYGEGSFIEPTKRYGMEYLETVKKVFVTEWKMRH